MARPAGHRHQLHRKLHQLVRLSQQRGYLTLEEIVRAASYSPEVDLEEVKEALEEAGIGLVEEEEEVAEPGLPWEQVETLGDQELAEEAEAGLEDTETAEEAAAEVDQIVAETPAAIYLREISRIPLLTASEEVALAKAIEAGKAAERALATRDLSAEERSRLEQVIQEAQAARHKLIESNLRLVVSVARKYMGRGMPLLDLIQEGNIGLGRAVEKYDWRKGYRFSTYAYWWIRQAITRTIADQARTIRVPVHMIEAIGEVFKVSRELQQLLGREPTPEEIGERMGVTGDKVRQIIRAAKHPLSLETPVGQEAETTIADFIADRVTRAPTEAAAQALLKDHIEDAFQALQPREREVLRLRFGLVDGRERTLGEIGDALSISRERVRQIESEALAKLRHPRLRHKLREYIEE